MTELYKLKLDDVRAWRRAGTDQIGIHLPTAELRQEVAKTESILLSREQAIRLASDITELLADTDPDSSAGAARPGEIGKET